MPGPEIHRQCRCIGKIHDPRAACPKCDEQIYGPFAEALDDFSWPPWRVLQPDLSVAVAIDKAVDMLKQVGPHGLWAGIATPCPAHRAGHQKQPDPGHHQQSGHIIKFMWPDFDVEHVETAIGKIDQHCLIWGKRAAIPAQPWGYIIYCQRNGHNRPFEPAKKPVDRLWIDALARLIERGVGASRILKVGH